MTEATIVIDVDLPAIRTWAGEAMPTGSLRIEVSPRDTRAAHSVIAQLAQLATDQLERALEQLRDQP